MEEGADPPLPFDEFENDIDARGGYLQKLAESINCFEQEIIEVVNRRQIEGVMMLKQLKHRSGSFENYDHEQLLQFVNQMLLPDKSEIEVDDSLEYPEDQRTKAGKAQDDRLPIIKKCLSNPLACIPGLDDRAHRNLVRSATHFFATKEDHLFKKGVDGAHKLVVDRSQKMFLMKASHDSLGHRGFFATKNLVGEYF